MPRATRLAAVRASLAAAGADALLVTDLVNVRYLTGFTGSAAVVLIRRDDVVFVTDGRYGVQAAGELAAAGVDAEIEVHTRAKQAGVIAAAASGLRVAIEAATMTVAAWRDWASVLAQEPVETTGLVERARRCKDAAEIARIRAAAQIAADAFAQVTAHLSPADREVDIAVSIEATMRRLGAEGPSFDTIVASGPNGALPHATPTDRAIGADPVVVDFGAMVDGYRSDTTRTIALGPVPAEQADAWAAVFESQQAGIAALGPGVAAKDIDTACRDALRRHGLHEYFTTGTGHGVGLHIHEDPYTASATDRLAVGEVITVEPGVYLPGRFGVRIEDFFVITETGAERLSPAALEPLVASG